MKTYKMKINGKPFEVSVKNMNGANVEVEVNGKSFNVELEEEAKPAKPVVTRPAVVASQPAAPAPSPRPSASAAGAVRSPLPGVVLSIHVANGAAVKRGDLLVVLEAMKMENNILADRDGTVSGICVNKGDSVLEGADLVIIS